MSTSSAPTVTEPTATPPAATPTNPPPSILDTVKKAGSDVAVTALKLYLPIVTNALTSLQNTSSIQNVAAQAAQAQASVIAAFPELEQEEIKAIAADTNTFVEALGLWLQQQATALGQPTASSVAVDTTSTQNAG